MGRLNSATLLLGAICCLFYFSSCKDPILEESGLLTGDDSLSLGKIDTFTIKLFTERENVPVSNPVAIGVVGNMLDPFFGRTYAGFYAQVRMLTNNLNFGTNPVADSMVLTLKYRNTYGAYLTPQDLVVFRLQQSLDPSIQYTADYTAAVQYPAIGNRNDLLPNTTDSVTVDGKAYAAHLRIRLNDQLAQEFIQADSTNFADNTAFLNFFKGFYIASNTGTPGDGAVTFDLYSAISGITLYYHNDNADSLNVFFEINSSCATINKFDHVYSGYPANQFLQNTSGSGDSVAFIQSGGGLKARILIPHLDSVPKNMAVNIAELVVSLANDPSGSDTLFIPPQFLELVRLDESGNELPIADAADDGTTTLVALRRDETVNGINVTRYHFRLNRYLQLLVNGSYKHYGFRLKAISQKQSVERVIIANGSNSPYKISFNLIYTKL